MPHIFDSKTGFILLLTLALLSPGQAAVSSGPQGDNERAVAVLEQAAKADPNNAELWVHLGFAYRKGGQMDQSQGAFEKAVALNPRSRDALYMLGLIYEQKHQKQDALKVWNEYLQAENDAEKRNAAEKHIHHLSQ